MLGCQLPGSCERLLHTEHGADPPDGVAHGQQHRGSGHTVFVAPSPVKVGNGPCKGDIPAAAGSPSSAAGASSVLQQLAGAGSGELHEGARRNMTASPKANDELIGPQQTKEVVYEQVLQLLVPVDGIVAVGVVGTLGICEVCG